MCRHASRRLSPEPRAAASARDFLRECLVRWELSELLADAEVAVSELVTNAVLHGSPPLVLCVSCENTGVEVSVSDGSARLPVVRPQRADLHADLDQLLDAEAALAEVPDERDPRLHVGAAGSVAGGRGLLLVDALAAQWGVSPLSDGKAVWIRTPVPQEWPHADDCPCATSDEASLLASGRRAVHRP